MADDLITVHQRLLERFRGAMNLVGPGPTQLHYDDAVAALSKLQPKGRWADLGTGAGFPGILFAHMFPDVHLDLVDSRQKRCWFIEHVLGQAELDRTADLRVLCTRVESLDAGTYDGIVSRAFAPPPKVLQHARRLLRPHGQVLLLLQDSAKIKLPSDFILIQSTRYEVSRKRRRSELLQWTHDAA